MLAVQPRSASPFVERAAPLLGEDAARLFADIAMVSDGGTIPQPQNYRQLAGKFGTVVWVYAAVARKMADVASVPLKVVRHGAESGAVDEVPRAHPLRQLLARVNPFQTFRDLIESISANLDLSGNAYVLKFADRRGVVRELWPMRPDKVKILASPTQYIGGYRVDSGYKEPFDFLPGQVMHFRLYSPFSDYYGMGCLTAAWNSAVVEEQADVWDLNVLKNSGRLDGVLQSDQKLTKAQAEENAARWRELHAGPRNAGRVAVLGLGLKYSAIATTPKDLDYVLGRKLKREAILAAIGVRPVILGLEAGDIGRRSEQIRDYFYGTIGARAGKIVDGIKEFLVPDFDDEALDVMADIETALLPYEDRVALAQADGFDISNGVKNPNEVRRRRGLPPRPGGDAYVDHTQVKAATGAAPVATLAEDAGAVAA